MKVMLATLVLSTLACLAGFFIAALRPMECAPVSNMIAESTCDFHGIWGFAFFTVFFAMCTGIVFFLHQDGKHLSK